MADIDDGVVQSLYEAAAGTAPWKAALTGLHAAMAATTTQLLVVDKSSHQLALAEHSEQSPPAVMLDHVREYHRIDPHVAHVSTMRVGDVLNTRRLFPARVYASHPFYREFWAGYRVREALGAKAGEDERHVAMVGLARTFDQAPYSSRDERRLGRYVGHLATALRISTHVQHARADAIVVYGLMQSSMRPMFLLDRAARVLAANDPARGLLAQGDAFEVRGGVLRCCDAGTAARLIEAIAGLGEVRRDGRGSARRSALRLRRADGSLLPCSLWDLRPELTLGAFGPQPAALLTVAELPADRHVDPIWLGSLFDLTPAEVRIAAALMRGQGLREIAAAQRVSLGTVRFQLKSIYAKTETHRQAQLVELLLRVAAL